MSRLPDTDLGAPPALDSASGDGTTRRTGATRRTDGARTGAIRRTGSARPSLRVERAMQRQGYRVLAGMDEVGRGALAGPVSVGVVLIDETCRSAPAGIRDSKLLPPPQRRTLVKPVRRWALAWAVGHAEPDEIDRIGIMAALRLAGSRALEQIRVTSGLRPDLIILDGNHDWLTDPLRVGLFAEGEPRSGDAMTAMTGEARATDARAGEAMTGEAPLPVRTLIKADRSCSSVAAASILAKVERDEMMIELAAHHPAYRWELNKGYAAPEHVAALGRHGPCVLHRRSWQLPGILGVGAPTAMGDDGLADVVEVSWT